MLHIGSTKTGSSALQATLERRRDELLAAGVLYPTHGIASSAHHLLAAAIHPGAWRMHEAALGPDRDAHFDATVAAIRAEADAHGAHTLVLSSEYFWESFPLSVYRRLRRAFSPARFELVAYLRRQDEWAASAYVQAVKSGEGADPAQWVDRVLMRPRSGLHYFRVINRWATLLGAPVTVLRYGDVKQDVYGAFCAALGFKVSAEVDNPRVNPSPSVEGVHRLLELNRSDTPEEVKRLLRQSIVRRYGAKTGEPFRLPADVAQRLLDEGQVSDDLICHRLLGRPPPLFVRSHGGVHPPTQR